MDYLDLDIFGGTVVLSDCSGLEIGDVVARLGRAGAFSELWTLFRVLPLLHSLPILDILAGASWIPEDERDLRLYRSVMSMAEGVDWKNFRRDNGATVPDSLGKVFDSWLARGYGKRYTEMSTTQLLGMLRGNPCEAVSAVAALSLRVESAHRIRAMVEQSPHWLVRCAGLETGLLDKTSSTDPVYWNRISTPLGLLLRIWPREAGLHEIQKLDGFLNFARRRSVEKALNILRLLLVEFIDNSVWDNSEFDVELDAAQFVPLQEERLEYGICA